jgi:hypothetical protein
MVESMWHDKTDHPMVARKEKEREGEEKRGGRGRGKQGGWDQHVPFKVTFPVTCVLQLCPTS